VWPTLIWMRVPSSSTARLLLLGFCQSSYPPSQYLTNQIEGGVSLRSVTVNRSIHFKSVPTGEVVVAQSFKVMTSTVLFQSVGKG
jgi:hypothetical protein